MNETNDLMHEPKRRFPAIDIVIILFVALIFYAIAPATRKEFNDIFEVTNQSAATRQNENSSQAPKPSTSTPSAQPISHPQETTPAQQPAPVAQPVDPEKKSITIALMPGQAQNFPNPRFHTLEIHSEYPLRILTGHCHDDYTVEFVCHGDPADIFITDVRRPPVFATPHSNRVTITYIDN